GSKSSASSETKNEEASKEEKKEESPKGEQKQEAVVTSSAVEKSQASSSSSNSTSDRVFVSPLAKKIAEEKGINLSQVKGSGENGRVVKRDIENFNPAAQSVATVGKFVPTGQEDFEEKPNSQ